ncbi:uncharacterized protein [Notamacropus eugenii]|uniref:uncharacterized protein n=1 Tax=Notamacropus eugenii TaxID=9315 RepID=UPI003B674C8E
MATAPDPEAPKGSGRSQRYSVLYNAQLCKLFVGGLNPRTDDWVLRSYFEAFGTLTDCAVVTNPQTHRSRCFGFITYSCMTEADRAMAASPHALDGSRVELKWAVCRKDSCKPGAHARVKKIFVGGLKSDVDENDLVKYFSRFGPVEKAEIKINKQSGRKRGFGFVHFFDHNTADKAAVIKFHPIQGHRVEVKKALPKEELDPWRLNPPVLGSGYIWRSSSRFRAGGLYLNPGGDSDVTSVGSLIPQLAWSPKPAWILTPKPAWIPNPSFGWSPIPQPGWDPDPQSMVGPNSIPVGVPKHRPAGVTWTPKVLTLGLDPKRGPSQKRGFSPKSGRGPNLKPGLLGPGPSPNPRPGILGPVPGPSPSRTLGFDERSGPRRRIISRGRGTLEHGRGGNSNPYGVCGGGSSSHSQYRAAFGPTKTHWRGGGYWRRSYRGGAPSSGGT